jgi:two-component system OmpR family sensor kinase
MAAQGRRLVTDLLSLAREDWAITPAVTDPEGVLRSVIAECELPDADVAVEGEWARVSVPEAAVRSVFTNLLLNAGHYGRDKAGHLSCTVSGAVGPGRLEVTFADRGEGIPAVVADRIFEPFATAPDTAQRNPESTGLGLAIVAATLRRHGGTAELLDDGLPGARFRLTLPLR